ncbi:MAG: MogA/MoaB family molybdenum cofactor biosynthesis protein [Chloroflexi bacterium]|nr:MogA/MoaB family molybdenum cofactor biosynthesis protein [Chloroflexota bacterium]
MSKKTGVILQCGILTISDRSARGGRPDLSGPALEEAIKNQGWKSVQTMIVPDDLEAIQNILINWSDVHNLDFILTTGGTGFAQRDITPEATLGVIQRLAPGLTEAMRAASIQVTSHAMLSRAVAGIRGKTLIINLPGSPKAAKENLETVLPVLSHAVELLRDDPKSEAGH